MRLTNRQVEGERRMVRGHSRRLFTSLCTKFNYQDGPNPLPSPSATPTRSVPKVAIIEYPTANGYRKGLSSNRRMVCVRTCHRWTDSFRSQWTFGTFHDTITLDVDTPQDHSDRTRKREVYVKPATKSYISEIRFLSSSLLH